MRRAAVLLDARTALVIGGAAIDDASLSSAVEQFDVVSRAWEALPPLPGPRSGSAVRSAGGHVLLFGGAAPDPADLFTVDVWDPRRSTWTRTRPAWTVPLFGPGDVPRWSHAVPMPDGSVVLLLQGHQPAHRTTLRTFWMAVLDPSSGTWSAPIRIGAHNAIRVAVGLGDGRLAVPLGVETRLALWSPSAGWTYGPDLAPDLGTRQREGQPTMLLASAAAVLQDGRLAIAESGRDVIALVRLRA